jgi:mRNA degradation ribonuclease J1/J2
MHLVESGGRRYLLDCGLNQGRRKDADAQEPRTCRSPASSIDAVVLSHAHIDHSGNLPTLVKNGFSGPIYATPATIDLCAWMLRDTAHIQEKDAEFLNKRHGSNANRTGLADGHVSAALHHGGCRAHAAAVPAGQGYHRRRTWAGADATFPTMPATSWAPRA